MTESLVFDVLHVLRLKGIVPPDALATLLAAAPGDLTPVLDGLAADGLVLTRETPRLSGWALTPAGRDRHAEEMTRRRTRETTAALTPSYERFLALNNRLKSVATSWQQLAPDDGAGRWEAIEELGDIHEEAAQILVDVTAVVPRFGLHARRLTAAMDRLRDGDERFFTGVTVDSFHTVWFECHEDFIQTLGRERISEGSF